MRPPEMVLLPRMNARLSGDSEVRKSEPTETLQLRVLVTLQEMGVQALPGRDLKNICRVFLHPPHAPGHDPAVAAILVSEVERQKRRSALFGLIDSYLDGFQDNDEVTVSLGRQLSQICEHWPWRPDDVWSRLHDEVKLFDSREGPKRIANLVMQDQRPVMQVLDSVNLGGSSRRKGGLTEAAFRQACMLTAQMTGSAALKAQLRLMEWAGFGNEVLIYPRAWWHFAAALFSPWRHAQPSDTHQNRLMDVAIKYAGDPRTSRGTKWNAVEEQAPEAYGVIMRWLTKASFEQFFTIVDQMTDRPDMWHERKRFWSKYLNASPSLISDAWVVFGKDGAVRAEQVARQNDNEAYRKFGRLGSGRTPQHTALIMKIGDLTIVEWSHNGKWNIWRPGDPNKPQFHKYNTRNWPDYEASELMYGPLNGSHHANWQATVAYTIRHETGLQP